MRAYLKRAERKHWLTSPVGPTLMLVRLKMQTRGRYVRCRDDGQAFTMTRYIVDHADRNYYGQQLKQPLEFAV